MFEPRWFLPWYVPSVGERQREAGDQSRVSTPHNNARRNRRRVLAVTEFKATTQHEDIRFPGDVIVPVIRVRSGRDQSHNEAAALGFMKTFPYPATDTPSIGRVHENFAYPRD